MSERNGDWSELKRRLQARFPTLTDKELDSTDGEREAVLALMEIRLGYGRQNAKQDLDRLLYPAADEASALR